MAKWLRVSKQSPCIVCKKPDFCTRCPELGMVLCMRVMSNRPSTNALGGWIHKTGEPTKEYRPIDKPQKLYPKIAWEDFHGKLKAQTTPQMIFDHAEKLGLDASALNRLSPAWYDLKDCWIYPMRDETGKMIGMRSRYEDGRKLSIKGSQTGLFITDLQPQRTVVICEGPTDTAAAVSLGYYAVGRPSCSSCVEMLLKFLTLNHVREIISIPDNDEPGLRGAESFLQRVKKIKWVMWVPPTKDLRKFLNVGGNREMIREGIRNLTWNFAN